MYSFVRKSTNKFFFINLIFIMYHLRLVKVYHRRKGLTHTGFHIKNLQLPKLLHDKIYEMLRYISLKRTNLRGWKYRIGAVSDKCYWELNLIKGHPTSHLFHPRPIKCKFKHGNLLKMWWRDIGPHPLRLSRQQKLSLAGNLITRCVNYPTLCLDISDHFYQEA